MKEFMQGKGVAVHTPFPSKNGKRILFANVPADGHFNPLTGLAVYLQGIGYEVRWYTSAMYTDKIKKLGIHHYAFKKALDVTQENVNELFPERVNMKSQVSRLNYDLKNFFILRSTEYLEDITRIYASYPFDLMIADCMFLGLPLVKHKLNVPVLSMGIIPLAENSRDLPPPGLGMVPSYSLFGKLKQAALRVLATRVLFRKSDRLMKQILKSYNIDPGKGYLFDVLNYNTDYLLQSGTPGFEYYRSDISRNVRFVGPLLPHESNKKRETWFDERLMSFDKVILVTQGTVEKDIDKILVPTLEAFKESNYLVVATTGGSRTEELKARFPQRNIIIEDFIPFGDVMPYANVYITNGGYGGVMLGIQHQLPLIVAGVHEGKNEINARIGYFELGKNLGTEKPSPGQIRRAVEEVLTNPGYKENVIKLGAEFDAYNSNELCAGYIKELLSARSKSRLMEERILAN
jgi:MGT family glycosyltransferase